MKVDSVCVETKKLKCVKLLYTEALSQHDNNVNNTNNYLDSFLVLICTEVALKLIC